MIFHGAGLLFLAAVGTYGLWRASQAESGPSFLAYLLMTLVAVAFLPGVIYRIFALQRARYILARDGISLYWGLRHEEIPIDKVTWVGRVEAGKPLSRPRIRFPGAVLGVRAQADGRLVEFMAGRGAGLVMIATAERSFAISPVDEGEFLRTYRRLAEFGSLTPLESKSDYPTFLLSRSWADRPARILIIASAVLALALIAWVSLSIPAHPMISLRLSPDGAATELVPGIRLLLLGVLNTFFFFADLFLGLFFYRRLDTKALGYLMWVSSILTSLLFAGAVYFILRAT